MKIKDLMPDDLKKLKNALNRRFRFMFSSKKEFMNFYNQMLENYQEKTFDSLDEVRQTISESIKDIIIEDILMNDSIYYIERYIAFSFSLSNNIGRNGLKDSLVKIANFLLNLNCTIPYEMIETLTEENEILQLLIANYIDVRDGFVLEEDLINHSNFYLRNMLFCYCRQNQIHISPRIKLKKEAVKKYDFGSDSYEQFYQELKNIDKLTKDELKELVLKAQQNDIEARNKIITAYLPLLKNISLYYVTPSTEYMELVQESVFGLIKAIEKYDPQKGSLIKYSYFWISRYIKKYIDSQERNRTVACGMREEEYPVLNHNYENSFSLFITPKDSTEEQVERNNLSEVFEKILQMKNLTENEKKVLIEIYGLNHTKERLLKEIGNDLNCTKQRVEQIHTSALNKIIRNLRSESLIPYCNYPDKALKVLQKARQSYLKNSIDKT